MKKRFFDRKGKSIVAILTSLALVLAMFVALPGVKTWADTYTHNIAYDNGGWRIWGDGFPNTGATTGTIPAGAIVGISNTSLNDGATLQGIANFSQGVETDNIGGGQAGILYTLTSPVNFSIDGNNIIFTAGAAAATEGEGSGAGVGFTPEQIAWAQYHDHAHNSNDAGFGFIVTTPVSEYSDGVEAWGCPECGYFEYRSPISAYDFFNGITTSRFNAAQPGQTITIEAGQWVSFHKSVIDALRKNREITTNIIYKSNGVLSTLTIPRGTDFSNVPEDKYMGIDYLAYCLGIVPVPKFG